MTIRSRVQTLSRDIEVIIAEELSPKAQSRHLAEASRQALAEAQGVNRSVFGRETPHETFVDGRRSDDLDSVQPHGKIIFEFELYGEVLDWIGAELVAKSPVLTGEYAQSHILFADGVEAGSGRVAGAEEYVFVNTVPYARKIERGLSPQAPDGVYEAIAAVAARRFGNIAKVSFTYRAVLGMKVVRQERAASSGKSWWLGHDGDARAASGILESQIGKQFGKNAHNKSDVRFPAIVVTF